MVRRRITITTLVIGGALALTACGSSSHSAVSTTTTSTTSTTSTTTTTTSTTTTTTTTPSNGAENLVATTQVKESLLAAGAANNNLTSADYVGLAPGATYYAYDTDTQMFYAGAALVPSSSSLAAQVSTQDAGAYLLFTKPKNASTWMAYAVGLTGGTGEVCPIFPPAAVLSIWGWPAHSCKP